MEEATRGGAEQSGAKRSKAEQGRVLELLWSVAFLLDSGAFRIVLGVRSPRHSPYSTPGLHIEDLSGGVFRALESVASIPLRARIA